MSTLTFKEYVSALNENDKDCNFIKDPKLRKQCKKLQKKSPRVRVYGGFRGLSGNGSSSGSGPGPGTGGGAGPGTGTGGGAFGGPGGGGGAFGGSGGGG